MFKRFTYMTQTERRTVLMLFTLIIVACALLFMIGSYRSAHHDGLVENGDSAFSSPYSGSHASGENANSRYYATTPKKIHLTYFDPNTADSTQLLALGLQPWQVRSIYRYRAAGGVYTCPEDFARLYGLTVKKYRELQPYIRISEDYRPASTVYHSPRYSNTYNSNKSSATGHTSSLTTVEGQGGEAQAKLRPGQTINLNTADTTQLRTIPGIGPYFARKIDRYRTLLGGFVSKAQLLEIPDFPESALPYFTLPPSQLAKLNINRASSEKLRNHPYISYMMAKQIADYRRMHGEIHDLNDLSLLPLFTPQVIAKLRPYITY